MIRRPSVRPPVPVTSFMTNMPCARYDVWQEEELFLLNLKKQEAADELCNANPSISTAIHMAITAVVTSPLVFPHARKKAPAEYNH